MPFVLDTSVAMAWGFEDEATPYADHVLELLHEDVAVVPAVWPLEIANVLCVGERRQRLRAADSVRFAELVGALPITVDNARLDRALGIVLDLARRYHLTSYDASYLELAMR
jgi:predicted nucleic acid-binding protein